MNKRNMSNMSDWSYELSPSQLHVHKKQNITAVSPPGNVLSAGQGLLSDNLQQKIAAIMCARDPTHDPSPTNNNMAVPYSNGGVMSSTPIPPGSQNTQAFLSTPPPSRPSDVSQLPPTTQGTGISDDDVLRIALTVKNLIAGEIQGIVSNLVSCIDTLSEENKKLQNKVDELEMYSRRSCIRVFGVDESREDTDEAIMDIASKLDVPLDRKDLLVSHRVGKSTGTKPRAIIARINNYKIRHQLIRDSRKLKEIPGMAAISVNQELTKKRASLAYQCRELVRKRKAKSTFIWDGKIFVVDHGDRKHLVLCLDDLMKVSQALG